LNRTLVYTFLSAMSLGLAACATTPAVKAPAPPVKTAATPPVAPPAPVAAASVPEPALPAYLDPSNPVYSQRSVFFDFDSALVKPDQDPVIELQGHYLAAHPELNVRVEGNTDERGSTEYNLALGQRRADSVRKALTLTGAREGQMEAISWGRDRPRAAGHDEGAWAQNRRADVSYPTR